MPTIVQWNASFSVGHDVLDRQHQQLLGLCNELAEHAAAKSPVSKSRFHEILNELAEYSRQHFKTEEFLLKQHGYAHLAEQQKEHLAYEEKVANWTFNAVMGDLDLPATQNFLASWWRDHILVSDMQYRSLMESKR